MKNTKKATSSIIITSCIASITIGCAAPKPRTTVVPYPLKECLVSQNELGSMGDVVTEVYQGKEIKFCCKPCVKKFHANPEKYLARLR
jgi:hypothetical protein